MIEWVAHCRRSLDSIAASFFENKHNCIATSALCTEYHNLYALLFVFDFAFVLVFVFDFNFVLLFVFVLEIGRFAQ